MPFYKREKIVIRESASLTHIDGFLVTDGENTRVTLSSKLNKKDKDRARRMLLDKVSTTKEPALFLWNAGD